MFNYPDNPNIPAPYANNQRMSQEMNQMPRMPNDHVNPEIEYPFRYPL